MTEADDGRRRFLMLMGLACASTTLAALAPDAIAAPAAAAPAAPAPPPDAAPPSGEARALADAVRARWPGRLDEAQQMALVSDLDDRLEGSRALRALPLANGDEPDFAFRA